MVTHCGDCDDWHLVAYAIISKINLEHGVNAKYFLTMTYDHAFLTVYYPDEGKWEIYDWFPPIGKPVFKTNKFGRDYMVLNGGCTYTLHISKDDCVVEIRRFDNYGLMSRFYSIYGIGPISSLYELPSLRYVKGSELIKMWD